MFVTLPCIVAKILQKIGFGVMAAITLHTDKINTCNNFLHAFIVILDHENIGLDNIFVPLSFIVAKILKKIGFSVMAAINLHTDKINTCDNFLYAFIAILDHENVGFL